MDTKTIKSGVKGTVYVVLGIMSEEVNRPEGEWFSYYLRINIGIMLENTYLTIDVKSKKELTIALLFLREAKYSITGAHMNFLRSNKALLKRLKKIDGVIDGLDILGDLEKCVELIELIQEVMKRDNVNIWDELRSTGYHELLPVE